MATKKQKDDALDELEFDPLDELNEFEEDLTIETEKDFFDEIEQTDLESVPQYDSKSGKIIEASEEALQEESKEEPVKEKSSIIDTITKVELSPKKTNKTNLNKAEIKDKENKIDLSQVKLSKPKSSMPKPKKPSKNLNADKTLKDDTKIIDNVKVDQDGVPLLNQFDTDKIKTSSFFPKITITKISMSKLIMIVVGLIITLIGIVQAMNDVVRISDHVMYGEHESLAFGLIFLGIIIVILAFYKEIMKIAGLNNLNTMIDDVDTSSNSDQDKKNK